jgi:hypothetical protein
MAAVEAMKMEYPVKNTYIEYPCQRSISLEMFVKERETQSEPIDLMSRLESLDSDFPKLDSAEKDSDPAKIEYLIKNTFIDGLADHPAIRSRSLEEFLMERRCKSAPNTAPNSGVMQRLESLEEEPCAVPEQFPATPENLESLQEEDSPCEDELSEGPMIHLPSPLQFPIMPGAAFHSMAQYQDESSPMPACSGNSFSGRSTMAPSDCDSAIHDVMPPLLEQQHAFLEHQDCDQDQGDRVITIDLESVLGKWSVGSTGHHFGRCKPCAFFWKSGCEAGQACQFCHTCPPDEKKKRTKQKLAWRKTIKAARTSLRYGLF